MPKHLLLAGAALIAGPAFAQSTPVGPQTADQPTEQAAPAAAQGRDVIVTAALPQSERDVTAQEVIDRLRPEVAKVVGITLYMQPVQDLSVEDRVSRTQFQYSVQSPDPKELAEDGPRLLEKLRTLPELRDCDRSTATLEPRLSEKRRLSESSD